MPVPGVPAAGPARAGRARTAPGLAALLLVLCLAPARLAAQITPDAMATPVSQLVARILENKHYRRHPLDVSTSTQALRMYLDDLDYQHMFFDKADVDTFETLYAESLGARVRLGDVQPAYEIFNKFLARLDEKVALVKKLTAESHDFSLNERLVLDRHEAPWPAAPQASADLWRLRVKHELLAEKLNEVKPEEIVKNVNLRYERLQRSYHEFDSTDVLQLFLTSLAQTFDPHSEYLGPPQKDTFDINMKLSLTGIGAVLRSEDGYAKIVSLVTGGPADVDKRIKPNDKIEAVAQGEEPFVDVVGLKLDRVVQMIRGEKGTVVRLRVIPNDAMDPATRLIVKLVRDEIKLKEQEAKAKVMDTAPGKDGKRLKLGVIDLPSFYADMKGGANGKSTTRDVARLVAELKKEGVDGVVLDLRRNGGGSLSEAISLTGLFIGEGPVVQVRELDSDVRPLRATDGPAVYTGPLVVLVSRASASASEILAAALQDYRRAIIVGEKNTFGKGTVQSMIDLDQYMPPFFRNVKPGAIKLTIQQFYRISGESTQNRGVIPDIHLPSVADFMDVTESSLKNALPFDLQKPADFARMDYVTSGLHGLRKASETRVGSSHEFAYVREDIGRYKKQRDDKSISLNEKKRLAEKKADKERGERRKKDRLARKVAPPEFKEITLDILDGITPKAAAKADAPAGGAAEPGPAGRGETASVAKSSGVVASTGTAPSGTAKAGQDGEGNDYDKAPPAPDSYLEEAFAILSDLVAASATGATTAVKSPTRVVR